MEGESESDLEKTFNLEIEFLMRLRIIIRFTRVLQIKRVRDSWRHAFGEGLVVCAQLTVHSSLALGTVRTIQNLKFE